MTRHGIQNNYDEYAKPSSGKVNNMQEHMQKDGNSKKESKRNARNKKH